MKISRAVVNQNEHTLQMMTKNNFLIIKNFQFHISQSWRLIILKANFPEQFESQPSNPSVWLVRKIKHFLEKCVRLHFVQQLIECHPFRSALEWWKKPAHFLPSALFLRSLPLHSAPARSDRVWMNNWNQQERSPLASLPSSPGSLPLSPPPPLSPSSSSSSFWHPPGWFLWAYTHVCVLSNRGRKSN